MPLFSLHRKCEGDGVFLSRLVASPGSALLLWWHCGPFPPHYFFCGDSLPPANCTVGLPEDECQLRRHSSARLSCIFPVLVQVTDRTTPPVVDPLPPLPQPLPPIGLVLPLIAFSLPGPPSPPPSLSSSEMPRSSNGKRKLSGAAILSSSSPFLLPPLPSPAESSSSPSSSSTSSSPSSSFLPPLRSSNNKRICASDPSHLSPPFSFSKLPSLPFLPSSSHRLSPTTSLISNAELELHSSPDQSEAAAAKGELHHHSEGGGEEEGGEGEEEDGGIPSGGPLPDLETDPPTSNLSTLSPSSVFRSPSRRRRVVGGHGGECGGVSVPSSAVAVLLSPSSHLRSPSPSSPSLSVFRDTPSKGRYSPSSAHSAFFGLSPIPHHRSSHRRSLRLTPTPPSPLHSPGLSNSPLFRSPHRMTPRSSRAMARASGSPHENFPSSSPSSSSPSRALPRSLTHSFDSSSLALPQSLSTPPLPSLLSPTLFHHTEEEGMTPRSHSRVSMSGFPWEVPLVPIDVVDVAPVEVVAPPKRKKKGGGGGGASAAAQTGKKGKAKEKGAKVKGKGKMKEVVPKVAVQGEEDSVDSLAAILPKTHRGPTSTLALPSLFSPSRDFSFPSTSLLSSRDLHKAPSPLSMRSPSFHPSSSSSSSPSPTGLSQARRSFHLHATPSSAASRASTASSNSSKRTISFSIIGANSPSPSASASVRLIAQQHHHTVTSSKIVRQRLTFEAENQMSGCGGMETRGGGGGGGGAVALMKMKEEGGGGKVEEEKKGSPSPSSSAPRQRNTTEFVMSDDGLLEKGSSHAEGEPRSLFAYRASTGALTPARFPPSPIEDAAMSPLRPRSYTFSLSKSNPPPFTATAVVAPVPAPSLPIPTSSPSASSPPSSFSTSSPTSLVGQEEVLDGGVTSDSSVSSVPVAGSIGAGAVTPQQLLVSLLVTTPHPSGVISIDGVPVKSKSCACKKSQCLKLYCECFAHGRVCVDCNCVGCHNTDKEEHQHAREKAIQSTRDRDANAFYRAAPLKAKAEALVASQNAKAAAAAATAAKAPVTNGPMAVFNDTTAAHTPPPQPLNITTASTDTSSADPPSSSPPPPSTTEMATSSPSSHPSSRSGMAAASAETAVEAPTTEQYTPGPRSAGAVEPGVGGGGGGDGGGVGGQSAAVVAATGRKGCNCKKSRCLKKYCECFQLGLKCTDRCKCELCANGKEHTTGEGGPGGSQGAEEEERGTMGRGEVKEEGDNAGGKVKGVFVNVKVERSHQTTTNTITPTLTSTDSHSSSHHHPHSVTATARLHLPLMGNSASSCTITSSSGSSSALSTSSSSSSTSSSCSPQREAEGMCGAPKLSTWKLLPSSSTSAAVGSLSLVSNAPPIPVTPLGPFTLPAPFELFESMRKGDIQQNQHPLHHTHIQQQQQQQRSSPLPLLLQPHLRLPSLPLSPGDTCTYHTALVHH